LKKKSTIKNYVSVKPAKVYTVMILLSRPRDNLVLHKNLNTRTGNLELIY